MVMAFKNISIFWTELNTKYQKCKRNTFFFWSDFLSFYSEVNVEKLACYRHVPLNVV
jgi:hypothetical protein